METPPASSASPSTPTTPGRRGGTGPALSAATLMAGGVLGAWGIAEAVFVFLRRPSPLAIAYADICYGVGTAALILFLSGVAPPAPSARPRGREWPGWAGPALIAGLFAVTALLARFALESFANSGDEYGYTYLADTLLHGRLWNPSRPAPLRDVLQTIYIADRDGRRLSQYPPGWPALLAGFSAIGLRALADPVIGAVSAGFLWLALRQVPVAGSVRIAALLLGAAAPFALFNAASLFSHSLTGACLLAIIWLDLRDGRRALLWNRVGLGFAFSLLLLTRYEDFAIAAALFTADGLLRRGWGFVAWAMPAALAGAPLAAGLLVYDWRVTGDPFETTLAWASPQIGFGLHAVGIEGQHSAWRGVMHTIWWGLDWQNFAPATILPLYCAALWRRIASRSLRWFDLLLPAVIGFFVFFPDAGGYQFGPRYWYFGWVALPVTIASGLASSDGLWRLGRQRLDPLRLASLQMTAFAGFTLGMAACCHVRTATRMLPLQVAATAPAPALVLVGTAWLRSATVQMSPERMLSQDITRNGVGGDLPPVAIGNDLGPARTALLCRQLPDRHIFRLVLQGTPPQGRLEPACRAASPSDRTGD